MRPPPVIESQTRPGLPLLAAAGVLTLGLAFLFTFDPARYAFYPRCLFHATTGLHCPGCGERVDRDAPSRAARAVLDELPGEKLIVTYPVAVADEEHFLGVRESLLRDGYRGGHGRPVREVRRLRYR